MNRISNNTFGAIIALEAVVLGIFMGLKTGFSFEPPSTLGAIATLGGNRHIVGTIAALIFIPIFAKQIKGGVLAAMIFTSVTAILTSIGIVDLLFFTPGFVAKTLVTIAMLVVQILVIVFSYRVMKEMTESNL